MRVVILKTADEVSRRAAEIFAALLKRRPGAVLGWLPAARRWLLTGV